MVHPDLEKWFDRLHQDFGERIPSPSKTNKVVHAVLSKFNTGIKQYLGAGDNGIAFLANDGDVIKFTIDRNVSNISSSQTGPTLIYVVKAEYAPYPVTDEQAELIRNAKNAATDKIRAYFKTNRRTPEIYHRRRAIELVKQFEIVAASDDAFEKIPDMISDIADKFGGYIYDIEPSNFRRNNNGDVVIIDPSVPDLVGDIEQPEPLAFESKIMTALLPKIVY